MPQVNLEALVSVRISSVNEPASKPNPQSQSDDPPQSFWLSQDAEFDWFDRNAFLDRKDSTKGNSNTTPSHLSNSISQRLPVKKSILALPKVKRSYDVKQRMNRIQTGLALFPRRNMSSGAMTEPSSPRVSCMGRVRSNRDKKKTALIESEKVGKAKKIGFWKSVVSVFRLSKNERCTPPPASAASGSDIAPVQRKEGLSEIEGLMFTKRFVSGRRSDSWIGHLDLEKETIKAGLVVRQRSVGPLSELNYGPDLAAVVPVKA